jgi:transcriptional regulator with XRE-family HTH domain
MILSDSFKDRLRIAMGRESNRSFAERVCVSESALRTYLKGQTTPNLEVLAKMSEVSGYSLAWLASGDGEMKRGEDTAQPAANSGPVLDLMLLEHIIIEVIKNQRMTGDEAQDLFIEALARTTATTIINTYKTCLDMPTASKDDIISNYNSMLSGMASAFSVIHKHNKETGDLCVLEKGVIINKNHKE